MTYEELLSHVDHTLLKPVATWEQICKLCDEAIEYKTASVCVPPCYVKRIKEKYGDSLVICTVIGFPLGYETTAGKVADAKQCIMDGATEIDIVVNICEVKNGNYEAVREDIAALREATKGCILKVIIETCYLNREEKIQLCKIVTEEGADYIKTSTGFGSAGATVDDIRLFKNNIDSEVKIKAAGGIRSIEDATVYILEGCDRVGASAVVDAVKNS